MKEHIRDYWQSQAKQHGQSHWASWGDNWMIDLEIETIGKYISPGDHVIDIGCANGYSTFKQYGTRKPQSIMGVDFADQMIESANNARVARPDLENIEFQVGDVRTLDFDDSVFDVAYTTRVLINLETWEEQKKAILECIRIVKPGGQVILSEGFWEPLCKLNSMRIICGLPPLIEHDFNRYIKFNFLKEYLNDLNIDYEIEDFSSIYYIGSRLLRELITDPNAYPGFSNPINELFFKIEQEYSGGGFGIQQAVAIKKK